MSKAKFWAKSHSVDYVNNGSAPIEANTIIVFGHRIAIAGCDIPVGAKGSLIVQGIFEMPKKDATAISGGTNLYWNPADPEGATANAGSSPADAFLPIGYAAEDAPADSDVVLVNINA